MEHKVGAHIILKVVETERPVCEGCFFYKHKEIDCYEAKCNPKERSDKKNVIYKVIDED